MSCCETGKGLPQVAEGACRSCGSKGLQVPLSAVKALLQPWGLRAGVPRAPRFCASPACPVVYFDEVSDRRVEESELTVLVYAKHARDRSAPICYCFGFAVGDVLDAMKTGAAAISSIVRTEVVAGQCACEVKNPKGTCCLGDIAFAERVAQAV